MFWVLTVSAILRPMSPMRRHHVLCETPHGWTLRMGDGVAALIDLAIVCIARDLDELCIAQRAARARGRRQSDSSALRGGDAPEPVEFVK